MSYLRVVNEVVEYPFHLVTLKQENPNVSFPREISNELLAGFNVYPVAPVSRPAPTLTQDPAEQPPQLINGVWTQVWAMVDVSPEEAAQRQQVETDAADTAAVKADTFVQNFIAMTPAQVSSYVENNTANLAQVRELMKKMALMLLALARRQYR
jgi:hypothetical protein